MGLALPLAFAAGLLGSVPAASFPSLEQPVGPGNLMGRQARLGHSADGRPIGVRQYGDPSLDGEVLVVGCIHGTECAGIAVARRVRRLEPPLGAEFGVIADLNPDGRAAGVRTNGRGVDLNRNFPAGWRPIGVPGDPEHAGRGPFSEPETRLVRRVVRRLRPTVTIWFHQQAEALVRAWGPSVPAARRYARRARLPFRRMPWMAGTAPHWQNTAYPGTASFVVELAPGPLSARAAARHARAVLALAGVAE